MTASRYAAGIVLGLFGTSIVWFLGPLSRLRLYTSDGWVIDEHFGYSAAWLSNEWMRYGPEGQRLYFDLLRIDLVFPLLYTPVLAIVLAYPVGRLLSKLPRVQAVQFLPIAVGVLDWLEDGVLLTILTSPEPSAGLVGFASDVTMIKLIGAYLSVLLGGIGLVAVLGSEALQRFTTFRRLVSTHKSGGR